MTEKDLRNIFAANIKRHRTSSKLSQAALAKKAGVSINFINDLEAGKKWVSPSTMIKLAKVFDIESYELIKPPGLFPDNFNSIVRNLTGNIHTAVEEACLDFLRKEERNHKRES